MVAALSASGSAPSTVSMAPGPTSFSRATAFCVAGLVGSLEERISVSSRSARKFVKKLIRPFCPTRLLHTSARPHGVTDARQFRLPPVSARRDGGRGLHAVRPPPERADYATAVLAATVRGRT